MYFIFIPIVINISFNFLFQNKSLKSLALYLWKMEHSVSGCATHLLPLQKLDSVPLFQELVSSNTNQRNWRGILIALLVIVVVLALIVTSVVLLTPPDEGPRVKGARFKLQDILSHDFQPLRFNGTWVSGLYLCQKYFLQLIFLSIFRYLFIYLFTCSTERLSLTG